MGAFSMDLRVRAMRAVDAGTPVSQAARELQVSERWVRKLRQQRREGCGIEPQYPGHCGRPRKFLPEDEQRLREDVRTFPDATLAERVERLRLPVKVAQTWNWMRRLGMTHKKVAGGPRAHAAGRGGATGELVRPAGRPRPMPVALPRRDLDQDQSDA
jgi:transposase